MTQRVPLRLDRFGRLVVLARPEHVGGDARQTVADDLVAVGHTHHPLGDVVVQGHLPLAHQLEDEVGREGLGLAGDLELHVSLQRLPGGQIRDAGRGDERPSRAPDADQDSGVRFVSRN